MKEKPLGFYDTPESLLRTLQRGHQKLHFGVPLPKYPWLSINWDSFTAKIEKVNPTDNRCLFAFRIEAPTAKDAYNAVKLLCIAHKWVVHTDRPFLEFTVKIKK